MVGPGQGWFAREALRSEGNFGVHAAVDRNCRFSPQWGHPLPRAQHGDRIGSPAQAPRLQRGLVRPRMYLCLQSFCVTACISFQNEYSQNLPSPCAVLIAGLGGRALGRGGLCFAPRYLLLAQGSCTQGWGSAPSHGWGEAGWPCAPRLTQGAVGRC